MWPHRPRLGTAFIKNVDDLWPESKRAATHEWIRAHVDDILVLLEQMLRRNANVRRLPHRLHWLVWLLDECELG